MDCFAWSSLLSMKWTGGSCLLYVAPPSHGSQTCVLPTVNLMMKASVSLRGWCGKIQLFSGKKSPRKNLSHFLLWHIPSLHLCQGLFKLREQVKNAEAGQLNYRKSHAYRPAQPRSVWFPAPGRSFLASCFRTGQYCTRVTAEILWPALCSIMSRVGTLKI